MVTFQHNFVWEVFLMVLVLVSPEKYFSVDYNYIDKSVILKIHKYLNKNNLKQCLASVCCIANVKQVFIVLLSFSESLACDQSRCLFLNDEPCMIRPTLIDLNPIKLKYHPFMIILDKCTGSCNVLSPKICVPK